ncbi:hypothetical protein JCM19046_4875 [Bacillus sp. JCM 19046]|uniref:Ammonium transporter n=1 Tax=Shouchella xiaoxiensis TaxID=766895 RepID=A0ABS2SXI0_9BACI|nr:hypothetical protein [Shouchella xiaoxiensis]MBM7840208.1 hypothetical protein [Shouchella xiaoxiensis]GAF14407.1 hypothetical protein JCM19045_3721 [Bacillus sp. JCM 19045]GAF20169.1 hypothetical protein JCM19046_4875 [Bacillus sp. JCM 19046]
MVKKGIIALLAVTLLAFLAFEPSALAAAAESGGDHSEGTDTVLQWTLNILSVATLAFFAFLMVTDRG